MLTIFFLWHLIPFSHGVYINGLRGLPIKAYAYEYPPLMSAVKNSDGNLSSYKGFCADFIINFAEHFEMRLIFVQENASEVKEKGQYVSTYQSLLRKESDISCLGVGPSLELWRIMDFTTTALQEKQVLLLSWPEVESRLTAVIRPFNLINWSMIFISSLAFVGFLSVLPIFDEYSNRNELKNQHYTYSILNVFGKGAMYVIAVFTQHGGNQEGIGIKANRFSLRLMLGLWLLMAVVLVNLYSSTLTSFLTIVKLKPIPNSLEELVSFFEKGESSSECLMTMQKGNPILRKFYNATYVPYKKIGDWVAGNPKYSTTTQPEIIKNIVQHHCAHMGILPTSSFRIGRDYKENGKCRITVSKLLDFSNVIFTLQLQKDGLFTTIVNDFVLRVNSAGLMEHWKKWSSMNIDMCLLNKRKAEGTPKPIKLVELSSAYFVLGIGIALSMFAFFTERFVYSFQRIFLKRLSVVEV